MQVKGYPMDNFCIDRKFLLDRPGVRTLQHPEQHSIHCLVDVPWCYNSLYALLKPPAAPGGDYTVLYQLGQAGTTLVLDAAQRARATQHADFQVTLSGFDDGEGTLHCIELVGTHRRLGRVVPAAAAKEDEGALGEAAALQAAGEAREGAPPGEEASALGAAEGARAEEPGEAARGAGGGASGRGDDEPVCAAGQYLQTPATTHTAAGATGTPDVGEVPVRLPPGPVNTPNMARHRGNDAGPGGAGSGGGTTDHTAAAVMCMLVAMVVVAVPLAIYFLKVTPGPHDGMVVVPKDLAMEPSARDTTLAPHGSGGEESHNVDALPAPSHPLPQLVGGRYHVGDGLRGLRVGNDIV